MRMILKIRKNSLWNKFKEQSEEFIYASEWFLDEWGEIKISRFDKKKEYEKKINKAISYYSKGDNHTAEKILVECIRFFDEEQIIDLKIKSLRTLVDVYIESQKDLNSIKNLLRDILKTYSEEKFYPIASKIWIE